MLSVLIPVYNYHVLPLIEEVHKQLSISDVDFEIICFDDNSDDKFKRSNSSIANFMHIKYKTFDKNVGRSMIRNLLAKHAKFNWLLFLDADVIPVHKEFITNYLDAIKNDTPVICGGIQYQNEKPETNKSLRYVYGKKREEKSLLERNQNIFRYVLASNFLIDKKVFSIIRYDENLTQYGHEDTLFALNLRRNNHNVLHINNPVFHLGLENNTVFLAKTNEAIKNALYLYQQGLIEQKDIKLINKFIELQNFKRPIAYIFNIFKKPIIAQLTSKKPSLFLFDFYKLGNLCSLTK